MATTTDVRPAGRPAKKKDRTHYLYVAVIVAVALGIAVGLLFPDFAKQLKPLGTGFVSLIKMMIAPVIFCTIVLGIGSVRKASQVGKVGGIALVYFLTMSTLALGIGLVVGNIIHPGQGLHITPDVAEKAASAATAEKMTTADFLLHMIPTTLFSALTTEVVLQTLLVALLVGFALQAMGKSGEPILKGVGYLQKLVFRVLSMIMWVAPIGAFGAIAAVVGATGAAALKSLAVLMIGFYLACFVFVVVILGTLLKLVTGINIFKLFKYLAREFLLIVSTSSSESALPRLIAKMEHLGVSRSTVGVVVPTGYSFNLDGTAIYLTMASLFIATAMGDPLTVGRADLTARVHDDRVEGCGRCHRCRPGHPRRRPRLASPRAVRRRRSDRRHRPVHVRGPGGHQLRRQRGGHSGDRHLDEVDRLGSGAGGAGRSRSLRRDDDGRRRTRQRDRARKSRSLRRDHDGRRRTRQRDRARNRPQAGACRNSLSASAPHASPDQSSA